MAIVPDTPKLPVEDLAARFRDELIPLSSRFSYFSTIPIAEEDLKQYLHDLGVREMHRKRFVAGAAAWADRLRGEFDDAFPDEVPPSRRGDGAAAA